ncbi:MAG: CysB family HTH-type transcriptional regulator [Acidiferrobacter sp.]
MKLQQLRYLCEVVRQGLRISAAADALHTSQPGVSKQLRLLEEELGVDILVRNGKRVVALTEPGKALVVIAERMLRDAENLRRMGEDFRNEARGRLTIAVTHTQARYALPETVRRFSHLYPDVRLSLHQGNPRQIAEQVISGEADFGIATEALTLYDDLVTLPCYEWNHCVICPPRHPLLKARHISLEILARYPIVTYDIAFSGRAKISEAFEQEGLEPNVVLTAIDADVIKTYVELGLGIGIVAHMAFDPKRDRNLRAINLGHLFPPNVSRIGIRRGAYLRRYMYDFIEIFVPRLTRKDIDAALDTDA